MAPSGKNSGKEKNGTSKATSSKPGKAVEEKAPVSTTSKQDEIKAEPPAPSKATGDESGHRKPDQSAYNAEQERLKKEIDELNVKLTAVKDKIGLASEPGPSSDRRNQLKAELDDIRSQQGDVKSGRETLIGQLKACQETIQKKTSDLQSNRQKAPYKNVGELDAQVRSLEAKIESGSLKILEEKRTLQDITTLKRLRKMVEGFQADQDAIDVEKAKMDDIRKELDNPANKALSERYDQIKAELEELRKESDAVQSSRSELYRERDALQKERDELFNQKRESTRLHREAGDRYWAKTQEEKARKAERARQQRLEAEKEKQKEIIERMKEEASLPAYQAEIEDCQTLIDFFSGTASSGSTTQDTGRADVPGLPKLVPRTIDADAKGLVEFKRDTEEYFSGTKKKKGSKFRDPKTPSNASTGDKFSVPLAKLAALASLSIPPPISAAEVAQTIENLKIKKEWMMANQEAQTTTNKAKAEKDIAALMRTMEAREGHTASGPAVEAT